MKAYEAITKGKPIPKPGVPESFRVLVKELQSLGLDMRVLDEDDHEVELRDLDEGEDDDVMHVDDLEKARVQQAQEATELEKDKEEASDKTEYDKFRLTHGGGATKAHLLGELLELRQFHVFKI